MRYRIVPKNDKTLFKSGEVIGIIYSDGGWLIKGRTRTGDIRTMVRTNDQFRKHYETEMVL
jgi:hypothetical protein